MCVTTSVLKLQIAPHENAPWESQKMHLSRFLVALMAVASTSSKDSPDCPGVDPSRRCRCWNSDVTCDDLAVSDLNFLRPLPADYTRVFITRITLQTVRAGDLAALANVTSLTMQHDRIARLDPEALAPLVKLQQLDLAFNELQEFDLQHVNLPQLRSLDLSDNALLRLKLNPSLKRISSVILDRNRLQLAEDTFAFPNVIERLKISENRIGNDLRFLRYLSKVKTLWLSGNLISDIQGDEFEKIVNLEYLRLDSNSIKNVNFLKNVSLLKGLNLTSNRLENIPLSSFKNMSNLIHLHLGQNMISDTEFVQNVNHNLNILFLSNNKISRISSATVKGKKRLNRLSLSHNYISDLSFISELPSLEILSVDNNSLHSISKYQFNKTFIHFLDLSNNYIEYADFISHSRYLKYLVLVDNKLSKIHSSTFSNSKIEELDLSGNDLRSLDFIKSLSTIKNLFLINCNISHIPEDVFRNNPNLQTLDVSGNVVENMDFVFYASRISTLITNNCSIKSTDDSPLKCSRSIDISTTHGNASLSFIKTTNELWEQCYGKEINELSTAFSQWSVLVTITILSLVCLVLLLIIVLLETCIRFHRKRRNAYFEIENKEKKVSC